ncbi:hypothetical protein JHK85_050475 [Glycine max]|nr:hypothetical protein JHK85_050475 [Glycine max]
MGTDLKGSEVERNGGSVNSEGKKGLTRLYFCVSFAQDLIKLEGPEKLLHNSLTRLHLCVSFEQDLIKLEGSEKLLHNSFFQTSHRIMDKENNSKNNDAAQAQLKKNIILRDKRVCKPSTREKSKKLCDETHYRRKTPLDENTGLDADNNAKYIRSSPRLEQIQAKSDSVILEFLGEVITECKDLIHQLHKNTMKIGKDEGSSKGSSASSYEGSNCHNNYLYSSISAGMRSSWSPLAMRRSLKTLLWSLEEDENNGLFLVEGLVQEEENEGSSFGL